MSQQTPLDKQIMINKLKRMMEQANENEWYAEEQKLAVTGTLQGLLSEIRMSKYDVKDGD